MNEHIVKFARIAAALSLALSFFTLSPALAWASSVQVWWPTNGVHVSGSQPLKAMVPGLDVSSYEMFWQVDGGTWNWMDNDYTDYQHKEADISVAGWNWHGSGPYTINFIVRKDGAIIAQQSEQIYIDQPSQQGTASAPAPQPQSQTASAPAQAQPPVLQSTVQTLSSAANTVASNFYVDPNSDAAKQEAAWSGADAQAMGVLASQPTAVWLGDWSGNIQNDVHSLVSKAQSNGTMPVMVAYDIPERDCGGFSSGGSNNPSGYINWINSFAQGIGSAPATVILEPDGLASLGCLSNADQGTREWLIGQAVQRLKQNGNTKVYIDAGHSGWVDPQTMASRLSSSGVVQADGFSLNVSNFDATSNETSYGSQISSALQGIIGQAKHFVIDTGRNGNGSNGEWCNPSGRAIGNKPTTSTGNSLVDAYLWVKTPGESDGNCNGGPSAGVWWPSYALSLVQNAH